MDRNEIIRMARKAGFTSDEIAWHDELLERFFQAAYAAGAAAERESCAKVCDDIFRHWLQTDPDEKFATPDADDCARAIRARGQ